MFSLNCFLYSITNKKEISFAYIFFNAINYEKLDTDKVLNSSHIIS